MKTARNLTAALGLGMALLAARPAAAQFHAAIGAHAGYSKTPDAAKGTFVGGAQFRLRLLSFLGAEALAEYQQTTYQSGGVDVLRVKDVPVQLSAMLYVIPTGPLQPYILGGVGCHFTESDGLGPAAGSYSRSQTKWAPQVGGGAELWTGKSFFLSADIRYVFLSVGSLSDVESQYRSGDLSASYWEATAGVNFKF